MPGRRQPLTITLGPWAHGVSRAVAIVLVAAVTACSSTPTTTLPVTTDSGKQTRVEDPVALLREAERSDDATAVRLRLRAAAISLQQGDIDQAERIFDMVTPAPGPGTEPAVDSRTIVEYYLLGAAIANRRDDPERAFRFLDASALRAQRIDNATSVRIGLLRSDAYLDNRSYIASARERILLDGNLTAEERIANHDIIFATLLEVPPHILASQAEKAVTNDVRGWLSLAAMSRQYQDDPVRQLRELNNWKQAWVGHPAASLLPASLVMLSQVVSEQPRTIALLLPLQGELAAVGRAIRDGVLAAHYTYNPEAVVNVYDTNSDLDIGLLLQQAVQDGAEIVIGPLDRRRVTALTDFALPVPVLALNRTENGESNPDLYQFGLAPEDEVIQVAQQIRRDGYKSGIVIAPEGEWGDRNVDAFAREFAGGRGNIVDVVRFTSQRDYSDMVKSLLKVDESEDRANELRRILGQRFEFTPRRRQDTDFIFLLGNPLQARSIKPTLAFFYADDIPVYATSHVYEISDSRIDNIDLNGIRFCDIPWKLTDNGSTLQKSVIAAWPASQRQLAAFYALGIDAYRLVPRLQQLKAIPGERLFGATGVLQLDTNVIYRRLMWARFTDGNVVTVPIVVPES